jgi:transcriptional regulator with XRE-family HTH domain
METRVGIRKFRDRMRFNQADLAKKLKVIQGNVSKWEAGKGTPSFSVARKLFEMGITVEELFGFEYNKEHGLAKKEITHEDLLPKVLSRLESMDLRLSNLEVENIKKGVSKVG